MTEHVIETDRLTKHYGDRVAVDAVSMTVRRGEVYGFLGPNGAGKTTTLRMVLGLVRPTSGHARVLGMPAGTPEVNARVGALVEGPGFFPYLTGRENLRVMARYRGLADRDVDQALDRVDLGGRGRDRFRSYSLGMKQRLGVASALMGDPDLVVLDEPSNGLDPAGVQDMRTLVADLAAEGRTVILSSHQLVEVQEICHRVGVVGEGHLLSESTVAELRGSARLSVRGAPTADVLAVAMRVAGEDGVHLDGDEVLLDVGDDQAPRLVAELVAAGVAVHEVRLVERSLEDVFFEMTGPRAAHDQEAAA
ncbi:ATP-binding cassette domain-containing protein [Solicola sp. PLA-1-18]|uniref:ABC transporter ATP-binding protein n=1 Tax=Solicola sp. PLA-1-18 TaxID=3380532 RepID=UPI003B815FFB